MPGLLNPMYVRMPSGKHCIFFYLFCKAALKMYRNAHMSRIIFVWYDMISKLIFSSYSLSYVSHAHYIPAHTGAKLKESPEKVEFFPTIS